MEGRKSGSWCFLTGKPMEKAIPEMSVRAMESIHLLLGGTACKSEVKSTKLKQCQEVTLLDCPICSQIHLWKKQPQK